MKLTIHTEHHRFRFILPLWFLKILSWDEENGALYRELYSIFRKEVRKYKGWVLCEVQDKDGTEIRITL